MAEFQKEAEFTASDGTVRKAHYGEGKQPWDWIVEMNWGAQFAAGNALKYVRRYQQKNGQDDLEKGRWYFARLKEMAATKPTAKWVLADLTRIIDHGELMILEGDAS